MTMEAENITKKINEWVNKQPSIQLAILFGSFAKGKEQESSDIDIAIELNKPLTIEKKLSLLQSLGEITDRKIDLIDLKTIGEPLLNQIIQHGTMLKGTKANYIELTIKNVNMMQDFTPYIQRTLKDRRERLLNG